MCRTVVLAAKDSEKNKRSCDEKKEKCACSSEKGECMCHFSGCCML